MAGAFDRQNLGTGLARGVADMDGLYQQWQRLSLLSQEQGREFPAFDQWVQHQGVPVPANMPRRTALSL